VKILLVAFALAGCTVPEREAPYTTEKVPVAEAGGFECDAAPAQYGIGKQTSTLLAQELMAKSGASVLRWMPPRTAATMDFRSERLNISYDDNMVIDRVSCG
jgi:Peptidase inhibitor I78 family